MSRSKHTDPRIIRAARRLQSPRSSRGTGDLSERRRTGALLRFGGTSQVAPLGNGTGFRLKIVVRPVTPGYCHPLSKSDIRNALEAIGPAAAYGLRSIELVRAPAIQRSYLFGRYEARGRIVLYEQLLPPWRLPRLSRKAIGQFERAGAVITTLREARVMIVSWPGDTLRRFMLQEVLLHEIGHHVLQHHKGKRPIRVVRSREHEAFAERFARRHRYTVCG